MKTRSTTPFLALALLGLSPLAGADLIDWGVPQDTTAISEISTNGTSIAAFNFFVGTTAANLTLNGVTFMAPFTPNEWDSGGGSLMAQSTTGDADFDELLTRARTTFGTAQGNPTGFGAIRLDTLVQLQMGQTYEIQVWYCDQRFGPLRERVMNLSSATGPVTTVGGIADNLGTGIVTQGSVSGDLDADPNLLNTPGVDMIFGSFVIGTFTRTSTDQVWLLVEGSHPNAGQNLRPHLNAMQIRAVDGASLGVPYCTAEVNSSGAPAAIAAVGSPSAAANDLTLTTTNLPALSFGFYLTSLTQGFVPNPGGSEGNLCLGGAIGRYVGPGQIQQSSTAGTFSLDLDLTQHPQPQGLVSVMAGETWNWTTWFRDSNMGVSTSNLSNGIEVTFL